MMDFGGNVWSAVWSALRSAADNSVLVRRVDHGPTGPQSAPKSIQFNKSLVSPGRIHLLRQK